MDLITLDFETFYSKDFSLKKLTTEEYIRNPLFEVVGVGIKVNDGPTEWASGTDEQMKEYLDEFDWANSMLLAHNTMFDGAILNWKFGIRPKIYADTLCIARALNGVEHSVSLAALVERYGLGKKGTEIVNAIDKRREDFSEEELDKYGDYCVNDVELTYELFKTMGKYFPKQELKLIDLTLRMFIDPILDLDLGLLEQHLTQTRNHKDELLEAAGIEDKKELMSNVKFAELLKGIGVEPPTKVSPTTGQEAFAFAKTDDGFKALQEHDNPKVQALVAARLGNKSTLEETRTQRFIDIAKRGLLPVPVRYYAAHTGRWGGDDKINLQNLPSRGPNGKMLKRSIIAPDGYMLVDCDSSQIEARVLAWLAEQEDLVSAFANKEDVYVNMAARIYDKPEDEISKDERFVGKTTILGAGYGMGAVRFKDQLKNFGFDIELGEARRIIQVYRDTNWKINHLWRRAQLMLVNMNNEDNERTCFGVRGVVEYGFDHQGGERDVINGHIRLPSKLLMRYERLESTAGERGEEFSYDTRRGRTRIYGGKVIENVCQAIARCVIGEQMLDIAKKYRVVLTVHDSVVCCVPEEEVEEAQRYIEACMRKVPEWATGLPLDCESGVAKAYGDCE
jgi:DNA polymerase I-like protein with 3'-5' exonuclease and polymerase domains